MNASIVSNSESIPSKNSNTKKKKAHGAESICEIALVIEMKTDPGSFPNFRKVREI